MLGSGALLRVVIAALQDEIAYISLAVDPRHKRGQLLSHLVWLRDLSSDHLPQQDSQAEDIDLHGTEYHDLNLLPGLPLSLRAGTHQRPRNYKAQLLAGFALCAGSVKQSQVR